jgi:hypothetical protein
MNAAFLRKIARKTLRVFLIVYLCLLPVCVVVAYFLRAHKLAEDGHALSLPLFALMCAGIVLLYMVFLTILGLGISLFLWCLFDLMRSEFTHNHNKILWFVLLILLPMLGMIFYLIISPNQKINVAGDSSQ